MHCSPEKIARAVCCLSCCDVAVPPLIRKGSCGWLNLLTVAAGVKVTEREQRPRAGREAARCVT